MDQRQRLALAHVIAGSAMLVAFVPESLVAPAPLFSIPTLSVALIAFGSIGLLVGGVLAFVRPEYTGRLAIEADPSRLHRRSMYFVAVCVVLGALLVMV